MDLRETMKALCSECGPSGFEGPVAAKARQLIEPLCDETWIDKRIGHTPNRIVNAAKGATKR